MVCYRDRPSTRSGRVVSPRDDDGIAQADAASDQDFRAQAAPSCDCSGYPRPSQPVEVAAGRARADSQELRIANAEGLSNQAEEVDAACHDIASKLTAVEPQLDSGLGFEQG